MQSSVHSPSESIFTPQDGSDSKPVLKYAYNKNKGKKPKRNKSAFILFSIETRAQLKMKYGEDMNSNEMMVKLADIWKNLGKEEKQRYYNEAKNDKERYQRELDSFWKDNPSEIIQNRTKKNHVKKPCSAYALYLKEVKEDIKKTNPGLKMADVLKKVSEMWKSLDSNSKSSYNKMAEEEKQIARAKLGEKYLQQEVNPEAIIKKKRARQKNELRKQLKKENGEAVPVFQGSTVSKIESEKLTEATSTPSMFSSESNKFTHTSSFYSQDPFPSSFCPSDRSIDPQFLMQIAKESQQNGFMMAPSLSQFSQPKVMTPQIPLPTHLPLNTLQFPTKEAFPFPLYLNQNSLPMIPDLQGMPSSFTRSQHNHNGSNIDALSREALLAQIQAEPQFGASTIQNVLQAGGPKQNLEKKRSLFTIQSNLFPTEEKKEDASANELLKLLDKSVRSSSEFLIDLLHFDSNFGKMDSGRMFSMNSLNGFTSTVDMNTLGPQSNKAKPSRGEVLNNAILSALDFTNPGLFGTEAENLPTNEIPNLSMFK